MTLAYATGEAIAQPVRVGFDRRGKNTRRRLGHAVPPIGVRAIAGREGLERFAASSSQMGRSETAWPAIDVDLAVLMDLPGAWIDRVHGRRPPDGIILDMDSSESPIHGEAGRCGLERPLRLHLLPSALPVQPVRRPGALSSAARNAHSAEDWRLVLEHRPLP